MHYKTKLEPNTEGTDYFIGDIHGCYHQLMEELDKIGFDFENDRLIATGDIVDRGPNSFKCLTLLDEEWFYTVKGNHEELLYGSLVEGDPSAIMCWVSNGGNWHNWLSSEETEELARYLKMVNDLPLLIEVDGVLVVHAEYFDETTEPVQMTWGRDRLQNKDHTPVLGYDAVVCGHSPVKYNKIIGNTVYLDTGGWFKHGGGHFSIKPINEIKRMVGK